MLVSLRVPFLSTVLFRPDEHGPLHTRIRNIRHCVLSEKGLFELNQLLAGHLWLADNGVIRGANDALGQLHRSKVAHVLIRLVHCLSTNAASIER